MSSKKVKLREAANDIKVKFGSDLTGLLKEINKIKKEFITDFQVYKHNASTSSDLKKFKDLFNCYEKSFKSCENVCKEHNIFESVNYESFNKLSRINKWIVDDQNGEGEGEYKAKICLEQGFQKNIEEWFLVFIEAVKKQILEKYMSSYGRILDDPTTPQ